jgi:hypothetical protein
MADGGWVSDGELRRQAATRRWLPPVVVGLLAVAGMIYLAYAARIELVRSPYDLRTWVLPVVVGWVFGSIVTGLVARARRSVDWASAFAWFALTLVVIGAVGYSFVLVLII